MMLLLAFIAAVIVGGKVMLGSAGHGKERPGKASGTFTKENGTNAEKTDKEGNTDEKN